MLSLLQEPLCSFIFNSEHVETLVRHSVHRERNPEARHVRQPLHVPRWLQLWLHERSARWSFLQSAGPQLWLVPPSHVSITNKLAVHLMQIYTNFMRHCWRRSQFSTERHWSEHPAGGSTWQLICVTLLLFSRLWRPLVWRWGVHSKVSSPQRFILSIQQWVTQQLRLKWVNTWTALSDLDLSVQEESVSLTCQPCTTGRLMKQPSCTSTCPYGTLWASLREYVLCKIVCCLYVEWKQCCFSIKDVKLLFFLSHFICSHLSHTCR